MKKSARLDYALAVLAGSLALLLYWRTLAPGVLGGDSGEFQFAAWLGGLVHPTGYPLYLLLGHAWTHLLPWGTPAWRLNLLTAFVAALAVSLTYLLTLRALRLAGPAGEPPSVTRLLALVGAATFAAGPTFWSQAIISEVYALQAALTAALLLALLTWAAAPERDWPLYAAAACFGLGLVHHRSTVLLLPAVLLFVFAVSRSTGGSPRWRRRLGRALPLALLPLLLYLYVPLRAPQTPYLQIALGPGQTLHLYEQSFTGFLAYVSGESFVGAFRSLAAALAQLGPASRLFVANLTWVGVGLAGLGILRLFLQPRARPVLILTGVSFLAILGFNLFYGIGDIYVYYIPAYLVCCVWIAFGVAAAGSLIARALTGLSPGTARDPARATSMSMLVTAVLALAVPAWLLAANYGAIDQSRNRQAEVEWQARLAESIPAGAVLVTNDRDEMMPFWYDQNVNGVRADLVGLFPLILPGRDWSDVARVTEEAQRSGRPVFFIKPMPGLDVKFRLEPAGPLMQVLGPAAGQPPENMLNLDFGSSLRLIGYDVRPTGLMADGTITVTLYWQATGSLPENYTTFVHLEDSAGTLVGQDDHRPGGEYYPSSLWRPGETLRDVHTIVVSRAGISPYSIIAGAYSRKAGIQNLGQPQKIGEIP